MGRRRSARAGSGRSARSRCRSCRSSSSRASAAASTSRSRSTSSSRSASPPARSARRCCRMGASSLRPRRSSSSSWRRSRSISGLRPSAMAPASREVPLARILHERRSACAIALEIFLYSAAAGLFVVPIFAAVQAWAGEDRRARVVGAVNALNYIVMVGGSLATMILLQVVGLTEPMALVVLGVANIARRASLLPPPAGELPRLLPARALARPVPARGRGARKPAAAGRARHHRRQSRLLPRRADPALAHGRAAALRDRPRHRRALVGEPFLESRRRRAGSIPPQPLAARALVREATRAAARLVDLPGRTRRGHRRPR